MRLRWMGLSGLLWILAGCSDDSVQLQGFGAEPTDSAPTPGYNAERNVYFGDLHVHTRYSMDAYLLGTEVSPDESYRYAKGETLTNSFGVEMALREPLDFYAVTDHGVFLGVIAEWADPTTGVGQLPGAAPFHNVNALPENNRHWAAQERSVLFRENMGAFRAAPADALVRFNAWRTDNPAMALAAFDYDAHRDAWHDSVMAAERHNDPGNFTAFIAYEWTASTDRPESSAYHRNVIFESSRAPTRPFSLIDSNDPEKLWGWMDRLRAQGVDSLAIPHNTNQSNGQVFRLKYTDGRAVDTEFAAMRMRNEPLVEITQVKGTSETHPRLSPDDEWADFEILNTRKGKISQWSDPHGSYVREALANGIALEQEGRGNPFKMGFVAATDTHNGAPSFDESNYFGSAPTSGTPENRAAVPASGERLDYIAGLSPRAQEWAGLLDEEQGTYLGIRGAQFSASGMAAVWAEENTREAIFAAFRRKETYGTSGNRIRVRFFGGFDLAELDLDAADLTAQAYVRGVPMGGDLVAGDASPPQFLVWAQRDVHGAPLQRVQIVKAWYDAGYRKQTNERVYDVACSDDLAVDPETHRCPDNGATVDLSDCSIPEDVGATELKTVWVDPDFDPDDGDAAYYVRVLENPTCRWTTWQAVQEGFQPRPGIAATIQERAWSSPIWYGAPAHGG